MLRSVIFSLIIILSFNFSDAGVSFTRWGRTVCPTGSQVLYKGYMAGPYTNAGGGGGNFLCVHETPKFLRPIPGDQLGSRIFGTEFDIGDAVNGLFKTDNASGGKLGNQDMVCVLCYVSDSFDKMMIPGRTDCGDTGYDLMYFGFLVAELNVDRKRSEYICLDEAPEGRPGGEGNNDHSIIYPVDVVCGSLPCDKYINNYEMTCALCTY